MLKALLARAHQGHRTMAYPAGEPPAMPDRFRGAPALDPAKCPDGCRSCADVCPTDAISGDGAARARSRPVPVLHGVRHRLPGGGHRVHERLPARDAPAGGPRRCAGRSCALADALERKLRRLFGRSLKLRVVSAGDCNACSADVNVLGTIGWDLGRFGIQLRRLAAPRGRPPHHGARDREHAARAPEDVRRGAAAEDRHRRGGLRDQRRAVRGPSRAARRRVVRAPGRPLHPRLPAAPAHDSRRPPPAARAGSKSKGECRGAEP